MERSTGTAWSKEATERFLQVEDLAYQRIELGYGLHTPGRDRSAFMDRVFESDLRGKTVLDIGSYLGAFCLEALSRGASRAVGWEINPDRVRQARTIAQIKGLRPEYCERDIELESIDGSFDIVLCLNVLHHLRNPLSVLDKLIDATGERLVLEVRAMDRLDARQLGISGATRVFLGRQPVVVVGHGVTTPRGKGGSHTFLFSQQGLTRILGSHRRVFAPLGSVEVFETGFKNRFGVIAEKRRVRHLVLIAGPSSAGKTTLIQQLRRGDQDALRAELGIEDWSSYGVLMANQLDQLDRKVKAHGSDHLILHYDILRPWQRSAVTYEHDEALDLLDSADRISILTLVVDPEDLRRRFVSHYENPRSSGRRSRVRLALRDPRRALSLLLDRRRAKSVMESRRRERIAAYSEPEWLRQRYEAWFRYCDAISNALPVHAHVARRNDVVHDARQGWERLLADSRLL